MSKATDASTSDAKIPEQQFDATDEALPFRDNLRGTDRRAARQFIENLRRETRDSFEVASIHRLTDIATSPLMVRINGDGSYSYNEADRAAYGTGYELTNMNMTSSGKLTFSLQSE